MLSGSVSWIRVRDYAFRETHKEAAADLCVHEVSRRRDESQCHCHGAKVTRLTVAKHYGIICGTLGQM